jgi:hypothetical protein
MKRQVAAFALYAAMTSAHALVIGNLQTNDLNNTIIDTVTGREYYQFDEFNLTYAQTLAAVSSGGIYDGWSIATYDVADAFINAMLGATTPCTGEVAYGTKCGTVTGWADGAFGASFTPSLDEFAYLTGPSPANGQSTHPISLGSIYPDGSVFDFESAYTTADLDYYGQTSSYTINLLIYRDASVPEPGMLSLIGLGFAGMGILRLKSKQ